MSNVKKLVNVFVLMRVGMERELLIFIASVLISTHIGNVRLVITKLAGNFGFQKFLYILSRIRCVSSIVSVFYSRTRANILQFLKFSFLYYTSQFIKAK